MHRASGALEALADPLADLLRTAFDVLGDAVEPIADLLSRGSEPSAQRMTQAPHPSRTSAAAVVTTGRNRVFMATSLMCLVPTPLPTRRSAATVAPRASVRSGLGFASILFDHVDLYIPGTLHHGDRDGRAGARNSGVFPHGAAPEVRPVRGRDRDRGPVQLPAAGSGLPLLRQGHEADVPLVTGRDPPFLCRVGAEGTRSPRSSHGDDGPRTRSAPTL